ncbi:MAG: recombinase zinc beta ribbon domain-containing protein, partial [Ktedonobacteraceae bacterium]
RPRDPEQYLLIGHVYCGICGNRMKPICEKVTHVYRCNKHLSVLDPNPHCEPHVLRIKTSLIDPIVWEECCQLFERLDLIQAKIEEEVKRSLSGLLEDTTGKEQMAALIAAIEHAKQKKAKQQDEYLRALIDQDIQTKTEQLRRYEEECKAASSIVELTATYQKRVLEFIEFINVMRGDYHNAPFQKKRNALDVLGVRVHVRPDEEGTPPLPPVTTDQEWLSVSEVSELTGIHPNSLRAAVVSGRLKSERRGVLHTIIHRDEIKRFFTMERQMERLAEYEDEWFTVYKLTASVGISNHHDIHQAIAQGKLKAEMKEVMHYCIHRDELNRFLRESPTKSRSLFEDVSERIEITYSPLFVGTGVQAYKDAQQVVNVVHNAGLAKLVARLKPVIVVKG